MPLGVMLNFMAPERLRTWVQRAEAAGFDELWHEGGLVHMAVAASASQRAPIGSGILTAWVHEPAVVAQSASLLAGLTGGRFRLGIGAALNPNERFLLFQRDLSHPAPRMEEYVRLLRAYFRGDKGRFEGAYWNLELVGQASPHPIPIYLGALTTTMMTMAGRVADGVAGIPFWTARWARDAIRPAVERGRAQAGRQEPVPISGWVFTAIGSDRAQCRRDVAAYLSIALRNERVLPMVKHMGWDAAWARAGDALRSGDRNAAIDALDDPEIIDAIAITGTPAEARRQLEAWYDVYDVPVLFAPSGPRVEDYLNAIVDTFGR